MSEARDGLRGRRAGFRGPAAAALLALAWALPAPAAGQYFEPVPRDPEVPLPTAMATTSVAEVLSLAYPDALPRRTTGSQPMLIIPALFQDSPEPHIAPAQMQEVLFAGTGRTLTTFYREVSGDRLEVAGHVAGWVRTHVPRVDAAGDLDGHGWIGDRAHEHFRAAIEAVDADIDFRQYDNDGPDGVPDSGDDDGMVDAIAFTNIEIPGSCGGPGFWPHMGGLRNEAGDFGAPTADIGHGGAPIVVGIYMAEAAVDCSGVDIQGPNVMAHEFGHVLGLPDYYRAVEGIEPWQRHWVVGCFGLMGAGSWGCGTGSKDTNFGPTHMTAYSKWVLGWLELEEVGQVTDQEYVLEPVQSSGRALRVPLAYGSSEAFIIEYRTATGFDDQLPGEGVLIYHHDGSTELPARDPPVYRLYLVEADGDAALRRLEPDGGNRGVAADMFGRESAVDSVTGATTPSTAHNGGEPSTLVIHAIAVADGVARIRLSTTTPLAGTPISGPPTAVALRPYEARYRVSGGARPYTLRPPENGSPLDGLTLSLENGDEVVARGRPLDRGSFEIPLAVEDANGDIWWHGHIVEVADPVLSDDDLMEGLALPPDRSDEGVRRYLDNAGNRNGAYDIGDLRAYLMRVGTAGDRTGGG